MPSDIRRIARERNRLRAQLAEARTDAIQLAAAYIGLYADMLTYHPEYANSPSHEDAEAEAAAAYGIIAKYADALEQSQAPAEPIGLETDAPAEPPTVPTVPRRYCAICGKADSVMHYSATRDQYFCRDCTIDTEE